MGGGVWASRGLGLAEGGAAWGWGGEGGVRGWGWGEGGWGAGDGWQGGCCHQRNPKCLNLI